MDLAPTTGDAFTHDVKSHVLSIHTLAVPTISQPEEHLIRVKAVALTNGELTWPGPAACSPPIPSYELAGVVLSAPASSPFRPGSEVYARTSFDRQGSARQYSLALTSELGHKPKNLSWEEAATVPLSALTAWQLLFVHGGFAPPGEDTAVNATRQILIIAAAGGVGLWAVQLARQAGIGHIVTTCGPVNVDFVRSLGAHEIIDYTQHKDLSIWVRQQASDKFDLVVDGVGGKALEQVWTCVRAGGRLISIAEPPNNKKPTSGVDSGVRGFFFIVEANGAQLEKITVLIEAGICKAAVDSAYSLKDYEKAYEKVQKGHLRGKVVLKL